MLHAVRDRCGTYADSRTRKLAPVTRRATVADIDTSRKELVEDMPARPPSAPGSPRHSASAQVQLQMDLDEQKQILVSEVVEG